MKKLLNSSKRVQLEEAYSLAKDKRTANKINLLLLLDDGYSYNEVAGILRMDQSTIRRQEKFFREKGLDEYLQNPFTGGLCKLSNEDLERLEKHLDDHLCESTDEIIEFVQENFSVTYTRSGMATLLKRLGFVFKRPIIVPGKADLAEQSAFIDYYKFLRENMTENDKIFFLDGVHPQHNSQAGFAWIRKGKEKNLKSNTGRQRVNLNGALDIDTHEVIIREDSTLNAQSTLELFKMIENFNQNAEKIILIVDNAPYYYNGDVVEYINNSKKLELVYLPPYSPNLNLIERVWRFMKNKTIRNKYYEKISDFKATIGDFFQYLPLRYKELENLLVEDFQVAGC